MNGSDIFNQAFSQIREPRSEEYRRGVLAALEFRCETVPIPGFTVSGQSSLTLLSLASMKVTAAGGMLWSVKHETH